MKSLTLAAVLSELAWLGSLLVMPWNRNVFAFLALFATAFALYLLAWRSLARSVAPGRVALPGIVVAGFVFRATVFLSPPSLSDDAYRYLWDGRVQAAGISPYAHAPDDPALAPLRDVNHASINHKDVPTIYPPLAQLAFYVAARAAPTLTVQRAVFLGFDAGIVFLLIRHLRRRGLPAERVLLYAWNPLVLVEFASSGHVDSLALLCVLAGLYAAERGRASSAGAMWGLAFLGKLAAFPLIPWMVVKARARGTLTAFAIVVASGYAAYFIWPETDLRRNLFGGTATYARDWYFNAGLYPLLERITHASGVTLRVSLFSLVAALAFWLAARLRQDQVLAYTGIVFSAVLAVSPVVHPWYVVWLVPFLCFFPLWSGLALSGLVALSYVVLHQYSVSGVWALPAWVQWIEYGIPLGLLALEAFAARSAAPPAPSVPAGAPPRPARTAVVIPALNEEEALPRVLGEVPRRLVSWVIVVDNGSSDRTADVARERGALVVREERRGYGRAVLKGLSELPPECEVVAVMDGDHSDFPEQLSDLLAPIQKDEADFVLGSRTLGGAEPGSLTLHQRFGNSLSCWLIRLLFGFSYTDLGPFRAIRREALEALQMRELSFGWNVEMQIKAALAGLRIREVPVRYRARLGRSKISGTVAGSVRAGLHILGTIVGHGIARRIPSALLSGPGCAPTRVAPMPTSEDEIRSHRRATRAALSRAAPAAVYVLLTKEDGR